MILNASKEERALSWELSSEVHQYPVLKYYGEKLNIWLAHHWSLGCADILEELAMKESL